MLSHVRILPRLEIQLKPSRQGRASECVFFVGACEVLSTVYLLSSPSTVSILYVAHLHMAYNINILDPFVGETVQDLHAFIA